MPGANTSITAVWRAALAELERLEALDPEARSKALDELARSDPKFHAAVAALAGDAATSSATAESSTPWIGADLLVAAAQGLGPADLTGRNVGAYRFVRLIGAGGMGQVWLAQRTDGRFEGEVAVKLLDWSSSPALVERFKREGQVLARLAHPNIARLLDAGAMPSGQLYLVLELVDGQRIDAHADAHRATVAQRLNLFLDVCAAVSLAHANLVVHRDLKPSNILVTADGTVKLLDFGIAKLLQAEDAPADATELTRQAGQAMTLEYAAPEQVTGEPITTAADVYALGVVLYRLLVGTTPYRTAATRTELAQAVVRDEPIALTTQPSSAEVAHARASTPAALREALSGDLETIVHKALKKPPSERYASVQALADDVRRHLAHEPVLARPDTLGYRARKFVRRNRVQVGALTAVFATLVTGIGATAWQWRQAEREAQRTRSVVQVLTDVFTDIHPNRTGSASVPMATLLERGWQRVQRDLAQDADLHGEVARALGLLMHESGDSEATAQALEAAHAHLVRQGRRDQLDFLEVSAALASVWLIREQPPRALALCDEAIVAARASGHTLASETFHLQTLRGSALRAMDRLDEARLQLEDAADAALRVHGPHHASRPRALTELADIARQQARWDDARALVERAVEATPEDKRQESAAIRLHGAVLDFDVGRYADAAVKLERLVTTMTELLGEKAPLTYTARNWLALTLSAVGRHDDALREVDTMIGQADGLFGPDETASMQLVRARLQVRAGRADVAESAARAALHRYEVQAPDARGAIRARAVLGDALLHRGAVGQARELLRATVDAQRDLPASQDLQRLIAMQRHAVAVDLLEGAAAALAHYREAAALARARQPVHHPERLRAEAFEALAQARLEPTPQRTDVLRDKLGEFASTQSARADRGALYVHQVRLLSSMPAAGASASDLLPLLDY